MHVLQDWFSHYLMAAHIALLNFSPELWIKTLAMLLAALLAPPFAYMLGRQWLLERPDRIGQIALGIYVLMMVVVGYYAPALAVVLTCWFILAGGVRASQTGGYPVEWASAFCLVFYLSALAFALVYFPLVHYWHINAIGYSWLIFSRCSATLVFAASHLTCGLCFPWLLRQARLLKAIWKQDKPDIIFGHISSKDDEPSLHLPR